MKIAYQGVPGAYSYEACKNIYPNAEAISCKTFAEVIEKVHNNEVNCGILPIANSSAYRVANVHNLLPNMNLHIIKEYVHRVNHCLLGRKDSSIEKLESVYSHPQALMQCQNNCKKLNLTLCNYSNTAAAAQYISEEYDSSKGAIASKLAADLYGLKVLQENFQDKDDNRTTFWVVQKELCKASKGNKNVTTMILTTNNIVAALYKVLGGFATNSVNLLKIESYTNINEADFLITIEGHLDDNNVKEALREIKFFTKEIKVLGVYDRSE